MGEKEPVGPHVLKMIGYIEYLERLGFPLTPEAQNDLVLQSLNSKYSSFIMIYLRNEIEKPLTELLSMLRTAENNMKKAELTAMMKVQKETAKPNGKGKNKKKQLKKTANKTNFKKASKPKGGVPKEGDCHHCRKLGHWKGNCYAYLEDLKKKKGS